MGKMSRDKGKRGEREFAKALRDYGYDARRGCQYKGGGDSPDVVGLPNCHIEVKRVERLSLYDAMTQAKSENKEGEIPLVVHRKNNCNWVVILELKEFMQIYSNSDFGEYLEKEE